MSKRYQVVPLLLVASYACSGTQEQAARTDADASNEASSSDGSVGNGGSGGSGGASPADASQEECGPWGASGADPEPKPLDCNAWADGPWNVFASFDGPVLVIALGYYAGLGAWTDLKADVAPELGTLESIKTDPCCPIHANIYIRVNLADATTGGDITVDGVIHGQDQCHKTAACPAHRVLHIAVQDGGAVQVSMTAPPRLRQGRVALVLERAEGAEAVVRATGVPAGANIEFSSTAGELRANGDAAQWSVPPQPGLYQCEVVVQHQGAIATDALVVEVKAVPSSTRSPS
jgi:hypothetical protein